MRYPVAIVFMFVYVMNTYSQTFEIGPFIGGTNYIGDVGNTTYIKPNGFVGGALVKWNRSPRHAFRFSLLLADISADDTKSNDARRQQRGYSFNNTIAEASIGVEFNFWDFNLHEGTLQNTPYLYTGLTFFRADHLYLKNGRRGNLYNEGSNFVFAIPMVIGYKESITRHIVGALEIGARYTFTDNLDGSNPEELLGRRDPPIEFGNINTQDWYVFTGVNFTFSFGRRPCYRKF